MTNPPAATAASRKRPAAVNTAATAATAAKRIRTGVAIKSETSGGTPVAVSNESIKHRFLQLFIEPQYQSGISNSSLKEYFGADDYPKLVPIINELNAQSKLVMSTTPTKELFYTLVSDEKAAQFSGLDSAAKMVYQVIERAGNMGIWTKDIRLQTNIQQQALNKIFKALETRRLIKPVKSVTAKAKKLYMLYELQPAKELTGGVWYSDLEFDHEFISELRTFLMHCIRKLNGGRGVTLAEVRDKMTQAKVSRVDLTIDDIRQLMQTLVYDYLVEPEEQENGETLFLAARRITPMCDFSWWDAIEPDFKYRKIQFEDGVTLSAHEPHYHTS